MRAWELVKSRSILQGTSPVMQYFYCCNILLELKGNVKEKLKKISTEGNFHCTKMSYFPLLEKIPLC